MCHEEVGAKCLLNLGFDPMIATLVMRHVDGKRYLTSIRPEYHQQLSTASQATLVLQGGPMTSEEARAFEQDPHHETILLMRTWDDAAKVPNLAVPGAETYHDMMLRHCLD